MKTMPSRIIAVKDEGKDRRTITILNKEVAEKAHPGQFIMVWIPGVDEIPMGISHIGKEEISFTVHRIGEATNALYNKKVNEYIGVRGPYGRGFEEVNGKIIAIGGGTGIAPLMPLIRRLCEKSGNNVTVINGAKNVDEMIFKEELNELARLEKIRYMPVTEDGSLGYKGLATTLLEETLKKGEIPNEIYVCGPEAMIKRVLEIALEKGLHIQASVERYMKCAIGICGSCIMDPIGIRVCVEGPVIPLETLAKITELGAYKRDSSGRKIKI
ncbi:MAG: dihydroorotate dehydrogenase electron transfer subunit [archaeon YNP-LCB-024-027]|nr:dihydroorotate dehydrogenase electron transfer subunit [Candidatus Culexarchaeum yellowstonense]